MDEKLTKLPPDADDELRYWHHQIGLGIARRKLEAPRWDHNESSVRMDRYRQPLDFDGTAPAKDDGFIPINKVGSWQKTMRSMLAFRAPMPKLTPKTPDGFEPVEVPVLGPGGEMQMQPVAGPDGMPMIGPDGQPVMAPVTKKVLPHRVTESVLHNLMNHTSFGWEETISRLINAGNKAYGVLKVGYKPEFDADARPLNKMKIPFDPATGEADWSDFVPDPMDESRPMLDDDGRPIPKSSLPIADRYFIDWQHYRHMIHDPNGVNDISTHRWVAVESLRNIEDVKNDPMYSNTKGLEPTSHARRLSEYETGEDGIIDTEDSTPDEWRDVDGLVRIIEIYDMAHNMMFVMADGHNKWLYRGEPPEGVWDHPFAFYRPSEILGKDGEWYPDPPISALAPIADGINNMARLLHVEAKNSLRKWLVPKNKLDVENKERLESDEDSLVVEVENTNYGLSETIQPIKNGEASSSKFQFLVMLNKEFDEAGGLSSSMRGKTTDATATEIDKISSGEGTRIAHERGILRRTLIVAIKKLLDIVQATMSTEQAVKLIGEDGQAFVGMVDRELIYGDYDVSIDIEEMVPPSGAIQGARKAQLIQAMNQNPWPFADEILCREWCKDAGISDDNFIKALAAQAAKQVAIQEAMIMAKAMPQGPPQQRVPEAPPPESAEQAIEQTGAGTQVPRMQGAR